MKYLNLNNKQKWMTISLSAILQPKLNRQCFPIKQWWHEVIYVLTILNV